MDWMLVLFGAGACGVVALAMHGVARWIAWELS